MLTLRDGLKIFVALTAIDMRKSIDGLCGLVVDFFKESPQSGHLFLFCNQHRNRVKILYWDRNGFVIHYKRLERGRIRFKFSSDGTMEITQAQLQWLLAGLDFQLMQEFSDIDYSGFY